MNHSPIIGTMRSTTCVAVDQNASFIMSIIFFSLAVTPYTPPTSRMTAGSP